MLPHIATVADLLGIRRRKLLESMPLRATLHGHESQWTINVQIPENLARENRQEWKRNWSREWNAISSNIYHYQPREQAMYPAYKYQMNLIQQKIKSSEDITDAVGVLLSCPPSVTLERKYHLPHASLTKNGEIVIRCKNKDELELVAALGIQFSRSTIYAQKFYQKHSIPFEILDLQPR